MKFTPETLLQIYLDGSFTDEAQAEFDALVRRDPAFVEKVTQALSERLGPAPEEMVNGIAANLDTKIGGVWNQYKPSPALRYLRWGVRTAMVLAAAGSLFFGGRLLVAKFMPSSSSLAGIPTTADNIHSTPVKAAGEKNTALDSETSTFPTRPSGVSTEPRENFQNGDQSGSVASTHSPNSVQGGPVLPPVSTANQVSHSLPPSNGTLPPENAGTVSPVFAGAATAVGNSLRVAIDLEQSEKVDVTVFNANGLLVRHLYNGLVPSGEHYVDWDGKDQLGNAVLPGDYTVILDRDGKKMSGILKVLPPR